MRLPFLSLIVIVPAFLVFWIGVRLSKDTRDEEPSRRSTLYMLVSACIMLLIVTIHADGFIDGDMALIVLFVLPVLNGVLALLLVRWRHVMAVWKMDKVLISILLGTLFVLLISSVRFGGQRSLFVYLPALLVASVWMLGMMIGLKGIELASVLVGGFLMLEAFGVLAHPTIISTPALKAAYALAINLAKLLAMVLLAGLFYHWNRVDSPRPTRDLIVYLSVTIFLLFSIGAVEFRNAVLVKATGRAAEDHAPFIGLMLGVITGLVLAGVSKGKGRAIGLLYMFLLPVFLMVSFAAGWLVDPQAITIKRADRIHLAVDRFQLINGVYPASLEELTPRYAALILGPLTGRGQVWCYQSGGDYFRLGYVFFERYHGPTFPEPFYEVRTFAQNGELPEGEWMCDQELEKHKSSLGL